MQQATEDATGNDALTLKADSAPGASSVARGVERQRIEEDAVAACLGLILRDWLAKQEFERVKVLELILVKGWANKDAAAKLGLSEQQIANIRFAAIKKLGERIADAGLPLSVFPELQTGGPARSPINRCWRSSMTRSANPRRRQSKRNYAPTNPCGDDCAS